MRGMITVARRGARAMTLVQFAGSPGQVTLAAKAASVIAGSHRGRAEARGALSEGTLAAVWLWQWP